MTLAVGVTVVGVRVPLAPRRVQQAAISVLRAERVKAALLSVTFVSRTRIAALNREHLGRRGATDVIAFGLTTVPGGPIMGDIYVAPDVARGNAASRSIGVREELLRLVVHGVLHVLGYDHGDGDDRERSCMWSRQEALLRRVAAVGNRS
ncbi:MAG: hypothetical protein NVS1B4_10830 [Gemmatimonadaceae bacterium]